MTDINKLTLDYLNNLDRIEVLEQKYEDNIITGEETLELISLYRTNNKIRKKNKKLFKGDNMNDFWGSKTMA